VRINLVYREGLSKYSEILGDVMGEDVVKDRFDSRLDAVMRHCNRLFFMGLNVIPELVNIPPILNNPLDERDFEDSAQYLRLISRRFMDDEIARNKLDKQLELRPPKMSQFDDYIVWTTNGNFYHLVVQNTREIRIIPDFPPFCSDVNIWNIKKRYIVGAIDVVGSQLMIIDPAILKKPDGYEDRFSCEITVSPNSSYRCKFTHEDTIVSIKKN